MKRVLLLIVILFTINNTNSQIVNGDFETWSTDYQPANWFCYNFPGYYITVSKSADAYSGSFAARGDAVEFQTLILPPWISYGEAGQGQNISGKVTSVSGYLKFFPQGGDVVVVSALTYNNNTTVGAGSIIISGSWPTYQKFDFPIEYGQTEDVTGIYIYIQVADTSANAQTAGHLGTYFIIDDIAINTVTDVKGYSEEINPNSFDLVQNYPNPFNPSTNIIFNVGQESTISLEIFNELGENISTLIKNEVKPAGKYTISWNPANNPSGIYLCRLTTGLGTKTIKLMYLK